jgi:hypothetical protein
MTRAFDPRRLQGLLAVVVVLALLVGLDLRGAFVDAHAELQPVAPAGVQGVTDTTIKVVLYQPPEDDPVSKIVASFVAPADDNAKQVATVHGLIHLFENNNPSLAGRHVELTVFTGSGNLLDSVAARADAVKIAEDIKPFIVWGGPLLGTAFADELASRGVMCMDCVTSGSNDFYAQHAPYLWSLQTTPEQVGTQTAEYISKRLNGHPAAYAGDPAMVDTVRRFGLIVTDGQFGGAGLSATITDQLTAAGVSLTDSVSYADAFSVKQVQATMIGRLKSKGVTSVVYAGDPLAMRSFMKEATDQQWFPEWIMIGAFSSERSSWGRQDDPQQMRHAFGITPLPLPTPPNLDFITSAYRTANGEDPPAPQSMLLLFAPMSTFYAGLRNLKGPLDAPHLADAMFAAPPLGGSAATPYVPMISFGYKGFWPYADYAGIDDFAEIWWDPTARGTDELGADGTGMWAFADAGRRYTPGAWPTGPPLAFVPAGAKTVFQP